MLNRATSGHIVHSPATVKLLQALGEKGGRAYHIIDDSDDDFDVDASLFSQPTARAPSFTAAMGATVGAMCAKVGLESVLNSAQLYGYVSVVWCSLSPQSFAVHKYP